MSLKHFINTTEVSALIKAIRPKIDIEKNNSPYKISSQLSPQLFGTAIDYLIRIECQRRCKSLKNSFLFNRYLRKYSANDKIDKYQFYLNGWKVNEFSKYHRNAMAALEKYYKKRKTAIDSIVNEVFTLAQLDDFARGAPFGFGYILNKIEVSCGDIEIVSNIVNKFPYEDINKNTELNPSFGRASGILSGADADIISNDILYEIKCVKDFSRVNNYYDQLLGYFLLSRMDAASNRAKINRCKIYFGMHGIVHEFKSSIWLDHSEFNIVEKEFRRLSLEYYLNLIKN